MVVALRASWAAPLHPVRIDADGTVTPLATPAALPAVPGRLEEVETTAADGARVRGWLVLPEGDGPHPLLLWIHGGPLNSWNQWSWRWTPMLAAAHGYAVLLPDPALSTGYGLDFVNRGWNAWGQAPYTDLMAITDAVVARSDVDETRTAAMGGSFGGYMANWVAGHTDRFRAVVTHASLWALEQFNGTTDASDYWQSIFDAQGMHDNDPHRFVRRHHVTDAGHPRRPGLPRADRRGPAALVGARRAPRGGPTARCRTGSCTSRTRTTGCSSRSTRSSGTRRCSRSSTSTCSVRTGSDRSCSADLLVLEGVRRPETPHARSVELCPRGRAHTAVLTRPCSHGCAHTNAASPVIARPTMSVFTSRVPSYE